MGSFGGHPLYLNQLNINYVRTVIISSKNPLKHFSFILNLLMMASDS
jgi:hypothetical protein